MHTGLQKSFLHGEQLTLVFPQTAAAVGPGFPRTRHHQLLLLLLVS
jgi:hypothetical protein